MTAAILVAISAFALPAAGGHGDPTNSTVIAHDTEPGIDDATYQQHGTSSTTFDYLTHVEATWDAGSFADCGASNAAVLGIDRGGDDPGTETAENLMQSIESNSVSEDRFRIDFYDRDDAFGSSTHYHEGDEFVSLTEDCFGNPSEPGWYQIQSEVGGYGPDGEEKAVSAASHYFYICDCSNEREARDQLGPPPSEEPVETTAPTAGGEGGNEAGGDSSDAGDADTPDGTQADTGSETDSTQTPTEGSTESDGRPPDSDGGDSSGASGGTAATATPAESWQEEAVITPKHGDGPGFGVPVAVVGLLAAAMLLRRR